MAGLQSQNISVASTKISGPSSSDRDVCVFCRRRATPSTSDPHAPLFPFFSLVDCRHYACQPCALVHCDNAGRCILCPQCNCVSRLAQSGRRRNRSSASSSQQEDGGAAANRVFIDDGVSSVRSHRSATSRPSPHRSALKGQNGSSKKRSSSVQFPPNPTTSIVDADGARPGKGSESHRATSPLTEDAVAALPVDPAEARRQRLREQQQRRAAAVAAQAEKSVSLYAITAEPPKPLTATISGEAAAVGGTTRRSKERSHSQPAPKVPNTILEPKQVFPVPPPLVLHTIDEDEAAAPGTTTTTTAAPADVHVKPSVEATEGERQDGTSSANDSPKQPSGSTRDVESEAETRPPLQRAQLDDCEANESEERGMLDAVEDHERTKLRQAMEEAETAIHARRGLEVEFGSTPLAAQPEASRLLTDLSDQVSATSDDELSQRSSAHKVGSSRRSKRRTPHNNAVDNDAPAAGGSATAAATSVMVGGEGQKALDPSQVKADTPANVPSAARSVVGTASAVDTPSPMTAARETRLSDGEDESAKLRAAAELKAVADAEAAAAVMAAEAQQQQRAIFEAQERRARYLLDQEAEANAQQLLHEYELALQLLQRVQERREREAREEQQLFTAQQDHLTRLEGRTRDQLEVDATEERGLLLRQQEREMQYLCRTLELRDAEAQAENQLRQQQQQERVFRQKEQNAFVRRALEDRETMEREALCQTETAVRAHYERNSAEWRTALIPQELEAQRRARAAADFTRQQEQQRVNVLTDETAARGEVTCEEAEEWVWLVSGSRIDRVVAATEESERVQREYAEMRYERLVQQFQHEAAEMIAEEQRGRRACAEYEATTRSVLQNQCRVLLNATVAEEERLRNEAAQKAAARRDAALQQRWQRERDEVDADEAEARAVVREEEREERRTANMVFVQAMAAARRRSLLTSLTCTTRLEEEAEKAKQDAEAAAQAQVVAALHKQQQEQQRQREWEEQQIQQAEASRISADQLEELRLRQAQYEKDMKATLERLQEAERRVNEEAAVRARAEEERRASQLESERLIREAEQRAEQRIRSARDAAERLMQAQLSDMRDEVARRAEHAAAMQALAEEERRAVLEAKLQAAERQLQQAQQRAQEEVYRARDEAAAMAAAQAAQAAREAQRREAEWQERIRAEQLLRMAERENEKADAIRWLSELEARAAEAVQHAKEEAARNAALMEERMMQLELRQQAREAEVQEASQRVRNARDSMRDFNSCTQSSLLTTPSRAEGRQAAGSPQQQQLQTLSSQRSSRNAGVSVATTPSHSEHGFAESLSTFSAAAAVEPIPAAVSLASRHCVQSPPLAPLSSQTSVSQLQQPSTPASAAVKPTVIETACTPPRVVHDSGARTPLSSAQSTNNAATTTTSMTQSRPQAASLSPAVSIGVVGASSSLYTFDPADVVRAAIREAVMEIVSAQQQAQSLQDQAEQHVEINERRYRRLDRDRVMVHKKAELESSHMRSETSESPCRDEYEQSPFQVRTFNQPSPTQLSGEAYRTHNSCEQLRASFELDNTPSLASESSQHANLDESPLALSPMSSPTAAAAQSSVVSNAKSNTSSVYFDSQPYWTARDGRGNSNVSTAPAAPNATSVQPHRAASRVLFPLYRSHSDGAAAHEHAAPGQKGPRRMEDCGHAYYEPEPTKPAAESLEYAQPPPRRSTTRADTEERQHHPGEKAAPYNPLKLVHFTTITKTTPTPLPTPISAPPQPNPVCPRCYSADTTSPCWRCGEIICRRCGLQPSSARKLCCSAHLRAQQRDYTRQQQQQRQQQHSLLHRSEQQVQTSFKSSTNSNKEEEDDVNYRNTVARRSHVEAFADLQARYDAGTSTHALQEPLLMTPPFTYYRGALPPLQHQQFQQQQRYYFDHPGLYLNPVSVTAVTAGEPVVYPPGNPHMPYAYPNAYQAQQVPIWLWQQQQLQHLNGTAVREVPGFVPQQDQQSSTYAAPHAQEAVRASSPLVVVQQQQQDQQSQSAPQRVVDVDVEEAEASKLHAPRPASAHAADSATNRPKESTHERKRTSSASSSGRNAVVSSVPVAAATGARNGPQSQVLRNVQLPKGVRPLTPVKDAKFDNAQAEPLESTPDDSPAAPHEPKTESKKAAAAFFVPLDGTTEEEPRRPKPPTPRNYVPSKMFPPEAVCAAAAAAKTAPQGLPKAKKVSTSPQAANTRGNQSKGPAAVQPVSIPLRSQAARPALHDPYAAARKDCSARLQRANYPVTGPPQRRASSNPNCGAHQSLVDQQRTQPAMASYINVIAPMHPCFHEVRKPGLTVTTATSFARTQQRRSPSSDSHDSYTSSTSCPTSQPQMDRRAGKVQLQSPQRVSAGEENEECNCTRCLSAGARQRVAPDAPVNAITDSRTASHLRRPYDVRNGVDATGYLPQHPHLQSSQRSYRSDPAYYSHSGYSTAISETQTQQQQHRYAPHLSDPSTVSFNTSDRRVPTLAELDRRLQELRVQDEYEAALYQQRQSRLGRHASPQQQEQHQQQRKQGGCPSGQPHVHVLLDIPGGVHQQARRSRSPQLRTVSPPWRTDLNSSPLRPRWDISQPHSPVYHPSAAAAGQ